MINEELTSSCCHCCWNSWFTKAGFGHGRLASGNNGRRQWKAAKCVAGKGVDGYMDTGIETGDCRSGCRQYSRLADETATDGGLVGGLNLRIVVGRNKEWMGAFENSIQKDVGVIGFVLAMGRRRGDGLHSGRESQRGHEFRERNGRLCRISVVVSNLLFAVCGGRPKL